MVPLKYGFPSGLTVSADRNLVALQGSTGWASADFLFHRSNGEIDDPINLSMHGMAFSPDNRTVVYTAEGVAYLKDVEKRLTIKRLASREGFRPLVAFFGSDGHPKTLGWRKESKNDNLELWDMQSESREWRLEGVSEYLEPTGFSSQVFAARMKDDESNLGFFSMTDARKLASTRAAANVQSQRGGTSYHSPDGRFFLFSNDREGFFSRWVNPGKYPWLAEKMNALQSAIPVLGQSVTWTLLDLQSDGQGMVLQTTRPPNLEARKRLAASFHQDGSTLTIIGDDGLYDWDLPLKTHWFTPWAWVALAGWLGLGWLLFGRRRRSRSLDTTHRTEILPMAASEN